MEYVINVRDQKFLHKKKAKWTSSAALPRYNFDLEEILNTPPLNDPVPTVCPYCGGTCFVKNGHSRCQRQRYKCKCCGKTVTGTFGTEQYRSRLNLLDIKNISLFIQNNETIRATARRLGINRSTAHKYRKKLLKKMQKHVEDDESQIKLHGEYVMLDETFIPKFGAIVKNNGVKKRGISDQKMAVAVGIDACGHIKTMYAGVGHVPTNELLAVWENKINKNTVLYHDNNTCYGFTGFFKEVTLNSTKKDEEKILNPINSLCSSVQWFFARHHGVKQENVDAYLSWYMYLKNQHPDKKKDVINYLNYQPNPPYLSTTN